MIQMLYGCGDVKNPNEATINQLLDLTIDYLSETVKKAALISKSESLPAASLYLLLLSEEKQGKVPNLAELCNQTLNTY